MYELLLVEPGTVQKIVIVTLDAVELPAPTIEYGVCTVFTTTTGGVASAPGSDSGPDRMRFFHAS